MRTLTKVLKEGLFSNHSERTSNYELDIALKCIGISQNDYLIENDTITIKKVIKFIEGSCENFLNYLNKNSIKILVLDKKIMSGFSIDIKNNLDFGGLKIISHTLVTIRCAKHGVVLSNLNLDIDNTNTTLLFIRTPRLVNCKFSAETIKFNHALSLPVIEKTKFICTNMVLDIFDNSKKFFKNIGNELRITQPHTINPKVFDVILWDPKTYVVYDSFKIQLKDQNETQRNKCREIGFICNPDGSLKYVSDKQEVHFNRGY